MSVRRDEIQLDVTINGLKAGTTIDDLVKKARALKIERDKLAISSEGFLAKDKELKETNDLLATMRGRVRGVDLAMQDAGKSGNSFISFLKKGAAAAIVFFGVETIIRWGKEFVGWMTRGATSLDQLQRRAEQAFGSAISIVEDFADVNARVLGLTEQQYVSIAEKINRILRPLGLQRDAAAKTSSELTNVAGALADLSDGEITAEEAGDRLAKSLTGNTKALGEFGIIVTEADVKARLAARGQDELTGAALKQAQAQATVSLIMERSRGVTQSFLQDQESLSSIGNRLRSVWEGLKEGFLNSVIPALSRLGNAVANLVAPLQRQSDIVGELQAQFNVEIQVLKESNISQENRRKLIEQINTKYAEYLPNLLTEKTSLEDIERIQRDVNAAFAQRILLLASEESLREVSQKLIKAKREELDLAKEVVRTQQEADKADLKRLGQGRESGEQGLIRIATAALRAKELFQENQKLQLQLREEFDKTREAAIELGLDINAILNPPVVTPIPDPDPDADKKRLAAATALINKERELRIQALRFLVTTEEEFAARRRVINLEADNQISLTILDILKLRKDEELKLRNEITDREIEIIQEKNNLDISITKEQIAIEEQLRIQSLNDQALSEQEHADQLKIIKAQTALDLAKLDAQNNALNTEQRLEAQNDVAEKEKALKQATSDAILNADIRRIEQSRLAQLQAIEQLGLDEVDLQTARVRINLQADIDILVNRLATLKKGSEEALRIEEELLRLRAQLNQAQFFVPDSGGGRSTQEDGDRLLRQRLEVQEQIERGLLGVADRFGQQRLAILRKNVDDDLEYRLKSIDAEYEAKIRAARGNAKLEEKLRNEQYAKRKEAEKEAARARKAIARKEALIQGFLNIIEVADRPQLIPFVAALGALNVAFIDEVGFKKGGYTGEKPRYLDMYGNDVAGPVHTREWVGNEDTTYNDPVTAPIVRWLDHRQRNRGFIDGGYTDTTPAGAQGIPIGKALSENAERILEALLQESRLTRKELATLKLKIKAFVVLSELQDVEDELEEIQRRANV